MNDLDPQTIDQLASDYVLGTLSEIERARVTQLIASNPAVASAVRAWERRLLPLVSGILPVAPPASVWQSIETRIGPYQRRAPERRWRSAIRAHWLTAAALAAGIFLGIGTMTLVQYSETVPESYVGFLAPSPGARPALHASARRKDRQLFVKMITPMSIPQDQRLVLWALPADGPARRLGVVEATGKTRLILNAPADATFKDVITLAVFSESKADSAPSTPQGEHVLQGPCVKLW